MGEAVRLYAEDHPALAHKLKAKLEKRQEELLGNLIVADDWADYKHRVGVLRGLQDAIDICEEQDKALNGDR